MPLKQEKAIMFSRKSITLITIAAAAIAGCAAPNPPSRAVATPLFNKSGEALCRPEGQEINATYPARVPICEDVCEADSVAGANVAICPPIYITQRPPTDGGQDEPRGSNQRP